LGGVLSVVRRVDRLFDNVDKVQSGLEKLADRVRTLEDRMTALEANQEKLITEARTAAAVAASGAVMQHLVDMSRRLGAAEEQARRLGAIEEQLRRSGALEAGQGSQKRIE
jgi:hypothetical protein